MSDRNELPDWMQNTALVRQSKNVREAVERHKWYESERAGHDIGWEKALVDWTIRSGGSGADN